MIHGSYYDFLDFVRIPEYPGLRKRLVCVQGSIFERYLLHH